MISLRLEPWGEMAGIIAQLTRAARIRRDRRTYGTNKCLYTLQPFDTNGFQVKIFHSLHSLMRSSIGQASLHNKYCVQKARWEDHLRNIKEEEEIIINAYRQYKVLHISYWHDKGQKRGFRVKSNFLIWHFYIDDWLHDILRYIRNRKEGLVIMSYAG